VAACGYVKAQDSDPLWDDTIYAGGHFYMMGSVMRTGLLSLDAITGIIKAWSPRVPCCSGNLGMWAL
jgi:hypothetical protein